ncbi:hypothetical protein EDD29_0045 [Actinocorallia herbida]|uniref:Uncharacterized protein n=1 Tax=Actinocorallia herbida TaxID=58109 RepID=A0A3N1CMY7_9ACTN|nr:hypothetical protein [Actinocorallia herbida]ROO82565.1 hypothetical protein EDD29_0045 [Actinocorallia herbida]
MSMRQPQLGDIVRYVGRFGIHATRAAIVSCTTADVVPGGDLVPLDDETHVHLAVFTPSPANSFPEMNVPYDPARAPGTWHWPDLPNPHPDARRDVPGSSS